MPDDLFRMQNDSFIVEKSLKMDSKEDDEQLEFWVKNLTQFCIVARKILVYKTCPEITTDLELSSKLSLWKHAVPYKQRKIFNMGSLFLGLGLVNLKFGSLDF